MLMVRLQVMSDLHMEARDSQRRYWNMEVTAPNLALLGDIGDPFSCMYSSFISKQASRYENVIVILGNHEHSHNRSSALERARAVARPYSNVHVLEKDSVEIDGVRILGTTLWSDMDKGCVVSDFRCIPGWSFEANQAEHAACVSWLRGELRRDVPTIVLTHHAPLRNIGANPRFLGSPKSSAYASNLAYLVRTPVLAWFHGHTHWSHSTYHNGVLIASNAVGFAKEGANYEHGKVFDISAAGRNPSP